MISFFSRPVGPYTDKSSTGVKLTLNQFFDDLYFPHAKATKKQSHHDWSIYNKHMREKLGRYQLDCPSSYKVGHQIGLSTGGSGSFV